MEVLVEEVGEQDRGDAVLEGCGADAVDEVQVGTDATGAAFEAVDPVASVQAAEDGHEQKDAHEAGDASARSGMDGASFLADGAALIVRAWASRRLEASCAYPFLNVSRWAWTAVIAVILGAIQLYQHTSFLVVGLLIVFECMWVVNFNLADGFTSATGTYVFWYGLLTVIFGALIKMFIGDAVDANAFAPEVVMELYAASMVVMTPVIILERKVLKGRLGIAERLSPPGFDYKGAALGCLTLALLPFLLYPILPLKVVTAVVQVNFFGYFAVILGTADAVRSSGGRTALNRINVIAIGSAFLQGLIGFSKEGMLTPLVLWVVTCIFTGFTFNRKYLLIMGAVSFLSVYALVPISQVGRTREFYTMNQRLSGAVDLATNIKATRAEYIQASEFSHVASEDFFSKDVGFAGRLTRWASDDPLVSYTLQGHILGYAYLRYQFINWIPHIILPNKEKYAPEGGGNYYARELGLLPSYDLTTGISYGPPTEAFHLGSWQGVVFMLPIVWMLWFFSIDFICGDLRKTPWGILYVVFFSHLAPESGISGIIHAVWYTNLALLVGIFFGTRLAPLIGSFVSDRIPLGDLAERPMAAAAAGSF